MKIHAHAQPPHCKLKENYQIFDYDTLNSLFDRSGSLLCDMWDICDAKCKKRKEENGFGLVVCIEYSTLAQVCEFFLFLLGQCPTCVEGARGSGGVS